jgi:DNA-binding Lrp family transcriptional regulator
MISLDRINKAREAGYSDDDIAEAISRNSPDYSERIKKAREAGHDNTSILQAIERKLNTPGQNENPPAQADNTPANPPVEDDTVWNRTKNYFKKIGTAEDPFGKALSLQVQSGGGSGSPALTPKAGKKVAVEFATITAMEAAFAPIVGLAAASKVAPLVLESVARLTQAAATGAATTTTKSLSETGELPNVEELVENGLEWAAIDAVMQGLVKAGHLSYDFGKAVKNIADKEKVPATTVLKRLWNASKNYIKTKFNRSVTPENISPADVEVLVEEAKRLEQEIDITPKKKTFKTAKGSTYEINENGTTTRDKAFRPEHGTKEL